MNTPLIIAFGSNINPEENLSLGLSRLHALTEFHALSTIYRTQAVLDINQPIESMPDFLNGAVLIQQAWDPLELRTHLKAIEMERGRQPNTPKWASRPLDLDIVLMGDCILQNPLLTLPDPDILTRPFLAIPLAQLAPDWIHPVEKQSLQAIASRFKPDLNTMKPDHLLTNRLRTLC
ncbi:MAG: 2-amino-4-hydroxy-6-hydroxymethyldihydropteridine diphosphokinase [Magnetococcales bacterium]|nr:2-amino-4-hydroxy-6-hydroxymethyldihydropteridine diphosphokinase [Magnetococcales bacterium]MBF0438071.1 2-amino-4-hydroxy-6-hydroxymethyldihydropteridine diphosphokinase [Magnetococcales bacterium]